MNYIGWGWQIVIWMSLPLLLLITGIFYWRGLHREFPLFFRFLLVMDVSALLRFVAQFWFPRTYFYVYWITDLVITIANFLAVYELFGRRLFPRFQKVRLYRFLFPVAAVVTLFLAFLTALEAPDRREAFLIESRVLDFILVAVLGFFILLMFFTGRNWTRWDFAIAFGFAINCAAFLITSAVWVRVHYRSTIFEGLAVIAYDASCLIWLYYFSTGARPVRQVTDGLSPVPLEEARVWESMLKTWLSPGKPKS
jgi:hypothetical protein